MSAIRVDVIPQSVIYWIAAILCELSVFRDRQTVLPGSLFDEEVLVSCGDGLPVWAFVEYVVSVESKEPMNKIPLTCIFMLHLNTDKQIHTLIFEGDFFSLLDNLCGVGGWHAITPPSWNWTGEIEVLWYIRNHSSASWLIHTLICTVYFLNNMPHCYESSHNTVACSNKMTMNIMYIQYVLKDSTVYIICIFWTCFRTYALLQLSAHTFVTLLWTMAFMWHWTFQMVTKLSFSFVVLQVHH